jgi:hypothetical protein
MARNERLTCKELIVPRLAAIGCLALDLSKLSNADVILQLNRKDSAPLEIPVLGNTAQGQIVEALQQAEKYCSQLKIEFDSVQGDRVRLREAILPKTFAGEL